jgi:hypothetical protein
MRKRLYLLYTPLILKFKEIHKFQTDYLMRFVHFSEYKAIICLNSIHQMALALVKDTQCVSCKTGIKSTGALWMNLWLQNN